MWAIFFNGAFIGRCESEEGVQAVLFNISNSIDRDHRQLETFALVPEDKIRGLSQVIEDHLAVLGDEMVRCAKEPETEKFTLRVQEDYNKAEELFNMISEFEL